MIKYTVQGTQKLVAKFERVPKVLETTGTRALVNIGVRMASWARINFPESGLHVRSGDLRNSIAPMTVERTAHGLVGGMLAGQGLPYGPIQEFGGTIVPKNSQYLTIPLDAALTPSGVMRFDARGAEAAGYKTFVRGNIIFGIKDKVLVPLFVLVTSVTIPARPFAGPALPANREYIERELNDAVKEAVRSA